MQELKYVDIAKPINHLADTATRVNDEIRSGTSFFAIEHEYINGLTKPVTVITRYGVKAEIPPTQNHLIRDFIIRIKLHVGMTVNLNVDALLTSSHEYSHLLAQVINEGNQVYRQGQRQYSLDFHVSLDDIEKKGNNIYINNLDIVLSTLHSYLQARHPFGEDGLRNYAVNGDPTINSINSFGYSLKIVDTLGCYGDRYVNICGEVYKVPCSKSNELADGVYLTSSGSVIGDYALGKPISKRYTFEEADKELRLYRTVELARTLGDEITAKETELKNLSIELKREEQDLRQQKQKRDLEFEERKRELDRVTLEEDHQRKRKEIEFNEKMIKLKSEIEDLEHKRNIELMRQKDYYESRSYERKDTSEIVKFLPAIITGFIGFAMLLIKQGKSNS